MSDAVWLILAQQQVPLDFFADEQTHPDRRTILALAPTGSNGHATDVNTYNARAQQTRQRSPRVEVAATHPFPDRT